MLYKEPGLPVFGSRLQQVEHIAYAQMLAEKAGVHAPRVLKTGLAGPDAALLVTDIPAGPAARRARRRTDRSAARGDLGRGRNAARCRDHPRRPRTQPHPRRRRRHRQLRRPRHRRGHGRRVLAQPRRRRAPHHDRADRRQRARGAGRGHRGGQGRARGGDPAGAAGRAAEGDRDTARSTSARSLKQLRTDAAAAAGVEDVAPLKIKRLSLVNIGMLAGILLALAIAIPSLEGIDWATVQSEFENAVWGWAVLALILYPLVPISWATALMGCVNTDLPFVPTVLIQLACTFLNLITPNGIGGTALQLDYLHKEGVPGRVRRERDGAQHRRRRRDPDDPLPRRRVDHRDVAELLRHRRGASASGRSRSSPRSSVSSSRSRRCAARSSRR